MKTFLKSFTSTLAVLIVLPAVLFYHCGKLILGAERAFHGWSQAFSLIPGLSGGYLRRAFYRMVLSECAADVSLGFGLVMSHATAKIGRNVYVGPNCSLGDVTLGDDVLIGSHVSIMNGGLQHGIDRIDIPICEQPGTCPHIRVGRDTWIGDRAVIMADIGSHCVVGAGSVVTRPIPDYAVAAGAPARIIRYRNAEIFPKTDVSSAPAATAGVNTLNETNRLTA